MPVHLGAEKEERVRSTSPRAVTLRPVATTMTFDTPRSFADEEVQVLAGRALDAGESQTVERMPRVVDGQLEVGRVDRSNFMVPMFLRMFASVSLFSRSGCSSSPLRR